MLDIILKILLVALLLYIIANLFRGLFSALKNDPDAPPMTFYIGKRVGFSALIILIIILALAFDITSLNQRPY
ncbi:DUF2909 domain-containing protein [Aliidiomarina shirensis]|uniref:DUF2909 domain-containing protein n=1 Tax=Aliidiomarina shirensis TaxID=1048642 RepID=A0A432WV89_9GAMM|nr:DUF2909 domain-containing protein [Aliidiomarina shirensis]RUO37685.1 DUF2909 domain-containing protein [Aliidiomarina shirensis]